jgi:D-alanyl-D-alanine carboxypeptidase (penicillin-binding protein 5/6)
MNNLNLQNLKTQDKIALVLFVGMILFLFSLMIINNKNNHIRIDEIKQRVAAKPENPFTKIKIGAKAAIVWDMKEKKIIFSQNSEAALPLASLTKAMAALTAIELVPSYTTVTITKEFLAEEGDTGLLVDEKWSLKDLLDMSLLSSSNDGVRAIASVAGSAINVGKTEMSREKFINEMNRQAKVIGLTQTHFGNESGLDINPSESGAYGSAHDVALMFDYIVRNHNSLLEPTRYPELKITSLNNIDHKVNNTNLVVNSIPGLLGSKTGLTDLAGGNLAIITDLGLEGPYIIAVLGGTQDGRFSDVETLVRATEDYITKVK